MGKYVGEGVRNLVWQAVFYAIVLPIGTATVGFVGAWYQAVLKAQQAAHVHLDPVAGLVAAVPTPLLLGICAAVAVGIIFLIRWAATPRSRRVPSDAKYPSTATEFERDELRKKLAATEQAFEDYKLAAVTMGDDPTGMIERANREAEMAGLRHRAETAERLGAELQQRPNRDSLKFRWLRVRDRWLEFIMGREMAQPHPGATENALKAWKAQTAMRYMAVFAEPVTAIRDEMGGRGLTDARSRGDLDVLVDPKQMRNVMDSLDRLAEPLQDNE